MVYFELSNLRVQSFTKAGQLIYQEPESLLGKSVVIHIVDQVKLLDKHGVYVIRQVAFVIAFDCVGLCVRLPLEVVLINGVLEPRGYLV